MSLESIDKNIKEISNLYKSGISVSEQLEGLRNEIIYELNKIDFLGLTTDMSTVDQKTMKFADLYETLTTTIELYSDLPQLRSLVASLIEKNEDLLEKGELSYEVFKLEKERREVVINKIDSYLLVDKLKNIQVKESKTNKVKI